jgi:chitinase
VRHRRRLGGLSISIPSQRQRCPYAGPLYGNFAALQQLKQLHPKLKILISLRGAASSGFAAAAATEAGRNAFAASCIDRFIKGNVAQGISAAGIFDGIDIDWEFPTAADAKNATALAEEFRDQLNALGKMNHKHDLLTRRRRVTDVVGFNACGTVGQIAVESSV